MKKLSIILLGMAAYFWATGCPAATITVNWDGSGDYTTIQAGINAAADGDEVIVADGTYRGSGNRDITFGGNPAITVRSENGPYNCIIDCEGSKRDYHRGFCFCYKASAMTVDGFTIINAWSIGGSAIRCSKNSSPTIRNCIIIGPEGGNGVGILCAENCHPTISNCIISGNRRVAPEGGGGIYCSTESNAKISDCIIFNNSAYYGGGIYCRRGSPVISNCVISFNRSQSLGSGIHARGSPTITNSLITHNNNGGIACLHNSTPIITNCTIAENQSYGIFSVGTKTHPQIRNCIVWDNKPEQIKVSEYYFTPPPSVIYSNIQGGWEGIGNIDANPLFVNPDGLDGIIGTEDDNLRLLPWSPCIDVGDNSVVDANIPDLDGNERIINGIVDMGAYEALLSIEAEVHIVPGVINRNNHLKRIMAIIRLPEGIGRGDVVGESFELYAGGFDSEPVGAILERVIGRGNMTRVFVLFDKDEIMSIVEGVGRIELTVTGKLESGQYIYGSDTVRIIRPRRQRGRLRRGR